MEQALVFTPVAIGDFAIVLMDLIETPGLPPGEQKQARFEIQVIYDDGSIILKEGDLIPHLSAEQKAWLVQFLTDIRALAEEKILGPQDGE